MADHLPKAKVKMMNSDTDMEYNTGSMELITKDSGNITKLKVKALSGMLKVTFTVVNSKTIWPTAMESTLISTEANTRESSEMMFKKEMEKKSG